tara:strand:+ start:2367 stop:3479 length:1113 start_codon:yes stop_codon:yes gene_type:complete
MKNKLLIVTSEFPPCPGGIGNHAYNLAKQLVKNNFNVTVIAPRNGKVEDNEFDSTNDFKIKRYIDVRFIKIFTILSALFISIVKWKGKILIATGQSSLFCTSIFSKLFFKKSIAIFHGHELRLGNRIITYLLKILIMQFDKIIAVSRFSKDYALESNSNIKISIINNGFDPIRFDSVPKKVHIESNALKLVTLGSLSYRKGQHNVISSLPYLQKKYGSVEYEMIGNPYLEPVLFKQAKQLDVHKSIKFHGLLNDRDLTKILLRADIFIMLSENVDSGDVEGFGIAILEANYLGLPAIGSTECGIEDAISDGFNGKLINNKSPDDLYIASQDILNNYQRYSENSVEWAEDRTWMKVIDNYLIEIKNPKYSK